MRLAILYSSVLLCLSSAAHSQLLPEQPVTGVLLPQVTERLERTTQSLAQQKLLQQQQLLEQQRLTEALALKANLADPLTVLPEVLPIVNVQGQVRWTEVRVEQGFRAVEREWLLLVSDTEWQQLQQRWPRLREYTQQQQDLAAIGLLMITLKVPEELDSAAALDREFQQTLTKLAGRNHLYQPQQASTTTTTAAVTSLQTHMCQLPVTLGMIDTAIAEALPALTPETERLQISQQHFLPEDIPRSYGHGTAVAGVLAAKHPQITPLLANLHLYSASAFYPSNEFQQSATLAHILSALNWLVSQNVTVVNMSLTGPANPVLAATIQQLAKRDIILVAAAGNGGPAAAPLYPAAYEEVLAVTAVDAQLQLYRWANQGDYVEFAAHGVKVNTLAVSGEVSPQSGTSMATPVVSAAVGCLRAQYPHWSATQIRQHLRLQARDLGEPGQDKQFGYGVISAPLKADLQ
ncbi:S8 family serine peptidase [Rheinheimera sp. UJ51]|uniref:S8 family serine peptidase n=1 Tax=Rheinheimera sp. UJ51 TaxID=2892446 RepID=UPI001E626492|nr:S8 family serine peptidase [Rheinheimera sp. UJ51]MCC5452213.1 S8 family serine peptidase [Rheinheimera sp. UJ51]